MRSWYLLALALVLGGAPTLAQTSCPDGLQPDEHTVALYKFDEDTPGISADASGNGLDAIDEGTTVVSGRFCNARQFDGVDDRIDMDAARVALQGATAWTLEYVARAGDAGEIPIVLSHTCRNGWRLQARGTYARFAVKTTAGGACSWNADQDLAIPDLGDAWHYMALVFGEGTLSLYLDGLLVGRVAASGVFQGGGGQRAWIGHSDFSTGSYYAGVADELRVSDVARSGADLCATADALGWPCSATSDEAAAVPTALALQAPYPNPAATASTVSYALPETGPAHLAVYDLLGRRVATLAEGPRSAGAHTVPLDAVGLPGGVYVVRLEADGAALTRRLTVVR